MNSFFPASMLLLLLIAAGTGCRLQTAPTAASTIPDSVMVDLLIELHLAEARLDLTNMDQTATRDSIFIHYGISPDEFESAMQYYTENPDAYLKVYSQALDKLSDERYIPIY